MPTSTTPTVQQALAAVMADVREVRKTERNTGLNFNFRGIDSVLNAVGPALRTHGVVVLPNVLGYDATPTPTSSGKSSMHVIVTVEYAFVGPNGDTLSATVIGEAMDYGDKAVPKAMSVAFRTALLQALALPTDDPDPDASNYERGEAPQPRGETFGSLLSSITGAADLDALGHAAEAVQRATAAISPTQKDALRRAFAERKGALETTA